ncbi:hypothetical protein SDC9_108437 [bioreactor metagenome]|uniref:YD repeat-containing protein n=1 Tax=bioreactor metagenome TaxID=1076179 RepID=A0A645B850_9ZZZZ
MQGNADQTNNIQITVNGYDLWFPTYNIPSLDVTLEGRANDYLDGSFSTITTSSSLQDVRIGGGTHDAYEGGVGLLNKINYPTGGFTVYEYEPNSYYNSYNDRMYTEGVYDAGGSRIKSISHFLASEKLAERKTYKYGKDECGYGYAPVEVCPPNFAKSYLYYPNRITNLLTGCNGRPVSWEEGNFYRVREYNLSNFESRLNGRPSVIYPEITEYCGDFTKNTGKIKYKYCINDESGLFFEPLTENTIDSRLGQGDMILSTDRSFEYGMLLEKISYNNINGNYKIKESIKNEWLTFRYADFLDRRNPYIYKMHVLNECDYSKYCGFHYTDYVIHLGQMLLGNQTIKSFFDTDSVEINKVFVYNNKALLSTELESNSAGNNILTSYKYPLDYPAMEPYRTMIDKNKINEIVEQSKRIINGRVNKKVIKYNFFNWGNNVFKPISLEYAINDNFRQIKKNCLFDDKTGNVLSFQDGTGVSTVFLWGYNAQYPIAEIINATLAEVTNALVGTTPDQLASAIIPDMTTVEALRTHPDLLEAQITTYTYKPLVGMTSKTDPRGVKTTYEYDEFNRLKYIKDAYGNIIQKFDYHYKE